MTALAQKARMVDPKTTVWQLRMDKPGKPTDWKGACRMKLNRRKKCSEEVIVSRSRKKDQPIRLGDGDLSWEKREVGYRRQNLRFWEGLMLRHFHEVVPKKGPSRALRVYVLVHVIEGCPERVRTRNMSEEEAVHLHQAIHRRSVPVWAI
jgi:hypothetical protein